MNPELCNQPLAARMRPTGLLEFIGQSHLLGLGKPLRRAIENNRLHSMILWGPPGSGKTTLAKLLAASTSAHVVSLSAVLAGVKEIREVIELAKQVRTTQNQSTVLFVDEIHRFNKAQQDAFLPFVEDGTFTLIGATTENPSFELNSALLSRMRVYVLKRMTEDEILQIIHQALANKERGFGHRQIFFTEELKKNIAHAADGDARKVLNFLEMCIDFAEVTEQGEVISAAVVTEILTDGVRRFDKGGELFYDQISALHKSVRRSSPDAALYWLGRMIDGGCRPEYILRRIIRMASEDIGNADPRALTLALNAWNVYERLGSPEGELAIVQAILYLAVAPKSNACYVAWNDVMEDIKKQGSLEVPLHLRNAPTSLMKQLESGKNDLPEGMPKKWYYRPVDRGLEIKISEKLALLRKQ